MIDHGRRKTSDTGSSQQLEYAFYCDALEKQFEQAQEDGIFNVLEILELDKENSDSELVKAVDYFKAKNGVIEKDAPVDFLTEKEKESINRDDEFRPNLYCMLLSIKFSEAIENKSAFLNHSLKYAFDS